MPKASPKLKVDEPDSVLPPKNSIWRATYQQIYCILANKEQDQLSNIISSVTQVTSLPDNIHSVCGHNAWMLVGSWSNQSNKHFLNLNICKQSSKLLITYKNVNFILSK